MDEGLKKNESRTNTLLNRVSVIIFNQNNFEPKKKNHRMEMTFFESYNTPMSFSMLL